jgi:hypothetical protein
MSSAASAIIQIKRRPAGGAIPAARYDGELFFTPNAWTGATVGPAGSVELAISDGADQFYLVSAQRQVELQGDQTIGGTKTFTDAVQVGASSSSAPAPLSVGGQGITYLSLGNIGANIAFAYNAGVLWPFVNGVATQPLADQNWTSNNFLKLAGGTLSGPLVLAGNATAALNPVTLQQMQAADAGYVPLSGATMTGPLILSQDATAQKGAVTLEQMTAAIAAGGSGASISVGDNPPGSPGANSLWWNSTALNLYLWYNDGNSSQWVATSPGGISDAPADGHLYGRENGGWTVAAPQASPVFTGDPQAPTAAFGDNDTSIATTAFVQAAAATVGGAVGNTTGRNLFHNPIFQVQQRGMGSWAFSTTAGASVYGPDRWFVATSGANNTGGSFYLLNGALTAAKAQIGDDRLNYLLDTWTATAGSAATDFIALIQRIENVWRFSGKTVTISFWCNNTSSGSTTALGVSIDQYFGTGGSPSPTANGNGQLLTIPATNTWARYSLTFNVPTCQGKALGSTAHTDYTQFNFWLSGGSSMAARTGGVPVQPSAQFLFWGMQLEYGNVATALDAPDWGIDTANCCRYYQVLSNYLVGGYGGGTGIVVWGSTMLAVPMRAAATVVLSGGAAGGTATALSLNGNTAGTIQFALNFSAVGTGWAAATAALSADL